MSHYTRFATVVLAVLSLRICVSCRDAEPSSSEALPDPGADGGCPAVINQTFDNSQSPYMGGEESVDVEIDMVEDFHCPYCAVFAQLVDELWQNPEYQKRARIYFHNFPIPELHPDSPEVHYAARAVANQDSAQFWKLYNEIFKNTYVGTRMTVEDVVLWVQDNLDIDMEKFNADRISSETMNYVEAEKTRAIAIGVQGTPSVFVCGVKLGAWGDLEQVVDMYLGINE